MTNKRTGEDRRNSDGRRTCVDRRLEVVPINEERRSGIDRRMSDCRRIGIDRRLLGTFIIDAG